MDIPIGMEMPKWAHQWVRAGEQKVSQAGALALCKALFGGEGGEGGEGGKGGKRKQRAEETSAVFKRTKTAEAAHGTSSIARSGIHQ
jgi:hypothetical protein